MRLMNFIIFMSVFLTLHGLVNLYIYIRGLQALPRIAPLRIAYTVVFVVMAASYIFGRTLERLTICKISDAAIWIGSFWFAYMLYLFLGALLVDIVRAANHFIDFFPSWIGENYERAKLLAAGAVFLAATIVVLAGHINSLHPRIGRLEFEISPRKKSFDSLRVVLATDIHLGTIIGNSRLVRMVDAINSLSPDVVLLAGDIVDEDLAPIIEQNIGQTLCQIRSRYGVFAVTGNHEYIGGVEPAVSYLSRHGIRFLRDQSAFVGNGFYLIGREDRSAENFNGRKRKPLSEIMRGVDTSYPSILMDHQPFGLSRAARSGVHLQVSGHTHHGQMWPLSFITRMVYEKSWGHVKIGNTHFYVSCGFGTWGPPVRTGNRPEILEIIIRVR